MNRSSQRGVALVITLIMLSVVTITAVAFLAVTRRERASVGAAVEQVESRYLADTALARARAEVAARIVSATNRYNYDLAVSTNYINTNLNTAQLVALANGALPFDNLSLFTNTPYERPDGVPVFNLGVPAGRLQYRAALANLLFDPRAPVFVQTNRAPAARPEHRFYLDLNRNGRPDLNGVQPMFDQRGRYVGDGVLKGDPEWIGLLENPNAPHSGTNRFVGRYAYVVLPAGKTLDLNYIHNDAKRFAPRRGGFLRNQGVGAFELNLAGYLAGLNTNIWYPRFGGASVWAYNYRTLPATPSTGLAFDDADRIFAHRRGTPIQITAPDFYQAPLPFAFDRIDNYADGPIFTSLAQFRRPQDLIQGATEDVLAAAWPATDSRGQFTDVTRLLDGTLGPDLAERLKGSVDGRRTRLQSTYDQRTYYRLLESLGTDSVDGRFEGRTNRLAGHYHRLQQVGVDLGDLENRFANRSIPFTGGFVRRAKLNLNYVSDGDVDRDLAASANVTGFRDWQPLQWFTNAVHRILEAEMGQGLPDRRTALETAALHEEFRAVARAGASIPANEFPRLDLGHGIPVFASYVTNLAGVSFRTNQFLYDARVHQLLQLAANLYDATHYRSDARPGRPRADLPSVFRPVLYRHETNGVAFVRLAGFQEVVDDGTAVQGNPLLIRSRDALGRPWFDLSDPVGRSRIPLVNDAVQVDVGDLAARSLDVNVFGIPWVVGTKGGNPTFQEAFWQTRLKVTRRLRVVKNQRVSDFLQSTNSRPWDEPGRFATQVQYRYDIGNTLGMEAWNAYQTRSNANAVRLVATNFFDFAVFDETRPGYNPLDPALSSRIVLQTGSRSHAVNIAAGQWAPERYLAPLNELVTTNFVYDHITGGLSGAVTSAFGFVDARARPPQLTVAFTNRLVYALVDTATGRLLDFVNLRSVMFETNVIRLLGTPAQGGFGFNPSLGAAANLRMSQLWDTNVFDAGGRYGALTRGVVNQLEASLGFLDVDQRFWRDAPGVRPANQQRENERDGLYYFLFGQSRRGLPFSSDFLRQFGGVVAQAGFNPSPDIYLTDRRQANDPLVHYTMDDLAPGQLLHVAPEGYSEIVVPGQFRFTSNAQGARFGLTERMMTNHLGNTVPKVMRAHAPWGTDPNLGSAQPPPNSPNSTAFDVAFKDPLVGRIDDWNFPTNRLAGLGWIGRVHRGTPWQTVYLKAKTPPVGNGHLADRFLSVKSWAAWSGHRDTRPENDWRILDLFTTAVNDNSARGLLSVNQTNAAAWSAALAGLPVLSNTNAANEGNLRLTFVEPAGAAPVDRIVASINAARSVFPGGRFQHLGEVLAAPALTVGHPTNIVVDSGNVTFVRAATNDVQPFLSFFNDTDRPVEVPDEVVEQVPQQVLGLLRADEPRVVVYAYGQSLKPAPNSIVTRPGTFYGLCTNYVVTGEFATRTVVRYDGAPFLGTLRAVVEDHRTLPPEN